MRQDNILNYGRETEADSKAEAHPGLHECAEIMQRILENIYCKMNECCSNHRMEFKDI